MEKKILGFIGPISSGKGTIAAYYKEKYGEETIRFSTTLREILDILDLPHTRENTQKMFLTLAEAFGESVLSKVVAKKISDSSKSLIVVEGIRRPADLEFLKQIPGFQLIGVNANVQTRFSRLKQRNENIDDSSKTFELFLEEHKVGTEIYIEDLMKQAKIIINNNGDHEELYKQLDKLV